MLFPEAAASPGLEFLAGLIDRAAPLFSKRHAKTNGRRERLQVSGEKVGGLTERRGEGRGQVGIYGERFEATDKEARKQAATRARPEVRQLLGANNQRPVSQLSNVRQLY